MNPSGGNGRRGSARGPARSAFEVQRVANRAIDRGFVGGAHGKFVAARASDDAGSGVDDALNCGGGVGADKAREYFGAGARSVVAVDHVVFNYHSHPVKGTAVALGTTSIYGNSLLHGGTFKKFRYRINTRVFGPCLAQGLLYQLHTGCLTGV